MCYGRPQQADEQVVLLSQVLACDATVGYEDVANVQVLPPLSLHAPQRFNLTPSL